MLRNVLTGSTLAVVLLTAFTALGRFSPAPGVPEPRPATEPGYVGRQTCTACHAEQEALWRGSHHDLAMQEATEAAVLGAFDGATLTHFGVTSTFFRGDDGAFMVRTDGPGGTPADFRVAYTFGATPLQQYLVELPGGRFQALSLCWDDRPAADGGQRWLHLHPNEAVPFDDPLHWTGRHQNWNYMCAECHSTNLRKSYDPSTGGYATTWSEIDVSCEACHGPGSEHVSWARGSRDRPSPAAMDVGDEVDTCGRCHARRTPIADGPSHGRPLLDTHRPALLESDLYAADGQSHDEVYVYGSFVQSRMYHEGVTCGDCHEPHSLKLLASGNGVCTSCHDAADFDTPAHHFHQADGPGGGCVDCHMPERTYMVVDPRRDHSLRVPRPGLSVELGTPNACNGCHTDRSPSWAAGVVAEWYGGERAAEPHYGQVLHAGRHGLPGARQKLTVLADDGSAPAIVRATALSLLRRYGGPQDLTVLERTLADRDALVRMAALGAAETVAPDVRLGLVRPRLDDPILAVRIEAARVLVTVPGELMRPAERAAFAAALGEYRASQEVNTDRPEAHLNLGWVATQRGEIDAAEDAFRQALKIDPTYVEASVNLADLERRRGRDAEGERLLRQALAVAPEDAAVHHALGLLLVRRDRLADAMPFLARALELRPEEPRYAYVLSAALEALGPSAPAAP